MAGLSRAALQNKSKGKTVAQSPGIKKGTKRRANTVIQDEESERSDSDASEGSRSSVRLATKAARKAQSTPNMFGTGAQLSPIREEVESPTQLDLEREMENNGNDSDDGEGSEGVGADDFEDDESEEIN